MLKNKENFCNYEQLLHLLLTFSGRQGTSTAFELELMSLFWPTCWSFPCYQAKNRWGGLRYLVTVRPKPSANAGAPALVGRPLRRLLRRGRPRLSVAPRHRGVRPHQPRAAVRRGGGRARQDRPGATHTPLIYWAPVVIPSCMNRAVLGKFRFSESLVLVRTCRLPDCCDYREIADKFGQFLLCFSKSIYPAGQDGIEEWSRTCSRTYVWGCICFFTCFVHLVVIWYKTLDWTFIET